MDSSIHAQYLQGGLRPAGPLSRYQTLKSPARSATSRQLDELKVPFLTTGNQLVQGCPNLDMQNNKYLYLLGTYAYGDAIAAITLFWNSVIPFHLLLEEAFDRSALMTSL